MPEEEAEPEPVQNPLTRDVRVRSQAAQRKHAAKDSAGPTGAPRPPAVSSTRLICMPCLRPFADDEAYDANSSNDSYLSLSPQAQRIAANFVIMSLCFALNHAAVVKMCPINHAIHIGMKASQKKTQNGLLHGFLPLSGRSHATAAVRQNGTPKIVNINVRIEVGAGPEQ